MICDQCKTQEHEKCDDVAPRSKPKYDDKGKMQFKMRPGRLYRSCDCLHRRAAKAEPATGAPGE